MNRILIVLIAGALRAVAQSADDSSGRWSIHFQATSIGQHHGAFPSPYEGANSLPSHSENRVSLTTTAFVEFRVNTWPALETAGRPDRSGRREELSSWRRAGSDSSSAMAA